jgi:hypothetical protein
MLIFKNFVSVLLTILFLTLISGSVISCFNILFYDPIYLNTLNHYLIALMCITAVFFVKLMIFKVFLEYRSVSLFFEGLICLFLEVLLVLLVTLPVVGVQLKSLLFHFCFIGSICFFIPYAHKAIKRLLDMAVN